MKMHNLDRLFLRFCHEACLLDCLICSYGTPIVIGRQKQNLKAIKVLTVILLKHTISGSVGYKYFLHEHHNLVYDSS